MPRWTIPADDLGTYVDFEGAHLPSPFTLITDHDPLPTTTRLRVALVDGKWRATGLTVINPEGVPLDVELVEEYVRKLAQQVTAAVALIETAPLTDLEGRPWSSGDPRFRERAEERQRGRWITDALLHEVATVYAAGGRRPSAAVAEHFKVSAATASRWVKSARERSLIKPVGES